MIEINLGKEKPSAVSSFSYRYLWKNTHNPFAKSTVCLRVPSRGAEDGFAFKKSRTNLEISRYVACIVVV